MTAKIKVLVIDDSALVRQILTQGLALDPAIEVVAVPEIPISPGTKSFACSPTC
jgi:two-component system chemotaxis response regulator CheB